MQRLIITIAAAVMLPVAGAVAQSNVVWRSNQVSIWDSATITNHMPDTVEYMLERGTLTNTIARLAKEGHICRVLGHRWYGLPHMTLEFRLSGEYPEHRLCDVCGKYETKEPGTWK